MSGLPESYKIRLATIEDAQLIARHRAAMFRDMGEVSAGEAEVLRANAELWIEGLFAAGAYRGWIMECGGEPVCGGGVWQWELGPMPGCLPVGQWAHVLNVYTEPEHRRRGLARALMGEVIAWCAANV